MPAPRPRRLVRHLLLAGTLGLTASAPSPASDPPFTEEAVASGIDFRHFNGMSGELYLLENMGSGVALLDYDNDGDLDAYLVQGHMLGAGKSLDQATFPPPAGPLIDRLYRNDLLVGADGRAVAHFVDVTAASGIEAGGYGLGVTTGDFDNDGWTDLYVTNFGSNQLLRNSGDGTFVDVTAASGADDTRWSVSAAFLDFDADGWLDLYVTNYLDFSLGLERHCTTSTGARDYCGPLAYQPVPDRLFRNRGDGTFEDWTARGGMTGELGGALGVIAADFDGDGGLDIYVADDMTPNLLWMNRGAGGFSNEALLAGAAVSWEGRPEASMGVDAADYDDDGDLDLFLTHLTGETNTLYRNEGQGLFRDVTRAVGLDRPSWESTSFGTAWIDYDNDGHLDLLVVNGAVRILEKLLAADDPYPLHQPNQLFHGLPDGRFEEVGDAAGPAFSLSEVSRGAAFGDVDNDGDVDVLFSNNAGPARLLLNRADESNGWISLVPKVGSPPRLAVGTSLRLALPDRVLLRRSHTDGSYASASDPRVHAGLGAGAAAQGGVTVEWPGSPTRRWRELPAGAFSILWRPAR